MADTPTIVVDNAEPNVTFEKADENTGDTVGVNLDRDLLESLVNLENELTGIDKRKSLAEGSRFCDEITKETNKLTGLLNKFKTEKPSDEDIKQSELSLTTKVNDLIKYHHDNSLGDKADVDSLKTGIEKLSAAISAAQTDAEKVDEAQRILQVFISHVDQVDGSYKSTRRRMSTAPTGTPQINLANLNKSNNNSGSESMNTPQSTDRSVSARSVPSTPTGQSEGGMKHANTTPDFKKKKSLSVSAKKSKSKLSDEEIKDKPADEKDEKEKKKRSHERRTTLSLALPVKKEKEQKEKEDEKEKEKKNKTKSKTPREDGDGKKKKFSIKDSWKRLTSAFTPSSKDDKRNTMATADTGDAIDWDNVGATSPRKEKKEREKQEKEREKQEKEREKEAHRLEKEKEKEKEKQLAEEKEKEKEPKSPRRLRLSLSMRKKSKSKREDSSMIKSSPASAGGQTDRSDTSNTATPRTAREASTSEEKAPTSNGQAATNKSLKELPKLAVTDVNGTIDSPKADEKAPKSKEKAPNSKEKKDAKDTPPMTPKLDSPLPTPHTITTPSSTPRGNSPRAALVREISKKMLVAKRAPSQMQLRQIKSKLSQMRLAWDEYAVGSMTSVEMSEIDEHALDADIKELENMEGFDIDELVNFEPDGPQLDDANMGDELKALDNILDEFDDEFDTPSMREPAGPLQGAGGSSSYLSGYD